MTQYLKAKKGEITQIMQQVADVENMDIMRLQNLISAGQIVIPANPNHLRLKPCGIGKNLKIKVNANIGTSPEDFEIEKELTKLEVCEKYGADAVMDLSIGGSPNSPCKGGDLDAFRRLILEKTSLPVGTVPIYQAFAESGGYIDFKIETFLNVLKKQAEDGVDFVTIHAGITQAMIPLIEKRLTGVASRGGSFLVKWMKHHNQENPLLIHFDKILDVLLAYDVTISLGDGLRPGSLHDAGDEAQMEELKKLGELVVKSRKKGVQAMVEGPGHVPFDQIPEQIRIAKEVCHGAPFYVLGPLVTDIAAGHDHIAGAIGGTLAAQCGADFLCYLTPAEHLRLPNLEDVKEGIIASKITAHAADIARGIPAVQNRDNEMSKARKTLNWAKQNELCLDPDKFKKYRGETNNKSDACSMCGDWCAMKDL